MDAVPLTEEEKERLADRVVSVLRDPEPRQRVAELKAQVEAGNEGEEGLNSAVLAIVIALAEKLRL
jgi:PHD/YefM family antitoxin component YafN of YafNO toxin-antitoxin module